MLGVSLNQSWPAGRPQLQIRLAWRADLSFFSQVHSSERHLGQSLPSDVVGMGWGTALSGEPARQVYTPAHLHQVHPGPICLHCFQVGAPVPSTEMPHLRPGFMVSRAEIKSAVRSWKGILAGAEQGGGDAEKDSSSIMKQVSSNWGADC